MKALAWFKCRVYEWGFRPRPGTILYSPSLALIYGMRDMRKDDDD